TGSYTFSVYYGNRADKAGQSGIYTATLLAGTTPLCTKSDVNGTAAPGTFVQVSLQCVVGSPIPSGNLAVSLSCATAQCDFDMVSVKQNGPPATFQIFTFAAHLRYCTVCDGGDDTSTGLNVLTGTTAIVYQNMIGGPSFVADAS